MKIRRMFLPAALVVAAGIFIVCGLIFVRSSVGGAGGGALMPSERAEYAFCGAPEREETGVPVGLFGEKKFRAGVSVDGVPLGGLTYGEGEAALYESLVADLRTRSLTVRAGKRKYVFYYPEINCSTDAREALDRAMRCGERACERKALSAGGVDFSLQKEYYLANAEEVVSGIAADVRVRPRDSELIFFPAGGNFAATEPKWGSELDVNALLLLLPEALRAPQAEAEGEFYGTPPSVYPADLEKFTRLRARFSTNYGSSSDSRKHNIALAAKKMNGKRIEKGEEFSFNGTVGARTSANGFLPAKVISDGKYVEGVGGGVCQASTTVYNAALLAGLKVTEHHRHTLSVGYVEPSFDAMVNGGTSDMKFINDTDGPLFLRVTADGQRLTAEIYGLAPDAAYGRKSVVVREIPSGVREEIEDDTGELCEGETRVLQYAKNGIVSEGYLVMTKNGVTVEVKLRTDSYAPVKEIVAIGKTPREETCQPQ